MNDPLPADHPVNRQLAAYNDHDLDRFVACFAPTIRFVGSDGAVRAEGHPALHVAYERVFKILDRRAEIVNRIVVGAHVIDHEIVCDGDKEPVEALVGYQLVDGEIVEMRMIT